MGFEIDFGLWGSIFAVPTVLVDRHLRFCSESQLKVLLLALRDGQKEIDPAALGKRLGLSGEQTLDALSYWEESGIFRKSEETPDPVSQKATVPLPPPAVEEKVTLEKAPAGNTIKTVTTRRHLSPGEINDLMKKDARFPALIGELEGRFGKVFSPTEREAAAYLYRYLELDAGYILMAAAYCAGHGKTSLRYLEKTVSGWVDEGIDTFEKLEQHLLHLRERESDEARLKKLFGLPERKLTAREAECAARWCREYALPDELLRLAYDRTVDRTGKVSFPYMDKILSAWHQKGISSAAEAQREETVGASAKRREEAPSFDIDAASRMMNDFAKPREE